MMQNHIGELVVKPTKRTFRIIDLPLSRRLLITLPQLIVVFAILTFFLLNAAPKSETTEFVAMKIGLIVLILGCIFLVVYRLQFHRYEHIHQQKKYYQWGNVKPSNQKQLEALQLIAFSRFQNTGWTDTLESQPVEVRVKHIKNFRKKLDYFEILSTENEISDWVDTWGMSSKTKYEKLYNDLVDGNMHVSQFLLDYDYDPKWKNRLLELTELPESYFDVCMEEKNNKPKKIIWAWDLWRAINLSTAAFDCGFISEDEAWQRIYPVSDLAHYLFDDLEDFYNNIRLGHAYWCNNEKQVYERKIQIESFLKPKKNTERMVHKVGWTKKLIEEVSIPFNMQDNFATYIKETKKKSEGNKIGF